jgi:hypothetical protein
MKRMLYHLYDNFPAGIEIVHKQKGKYYKKIAKTNKRTCPKSLPINVLKERSDNKQINPLIYPYFKV